jgi:uncharacterized protein (TIGR02246 family)
MMHTRHLIALVLSLGLCTEAALADEPLNPIEANNLRMNMAFSSGYTDTLKDLYTSDATLIPPFGRHLKGKTEVVRFWESLIGAGMTGHESEPTEIHQTGNTAYTVGTWEARGPSREGTWVTYHGNVVKILERQGDGSWKTRLHMWNLSP